jgi:hypothetical protein
MEPKLRASLKRRPRLPAVLSVLGCTAGTAAGGMGAVLFLPAAGGPDAMISFIVIVSCLLLGGAVGFVVGESLGADLAGDGERSASPGCDLTGAGNEQRLPRAPAPPDAITRPTDGITKPPASGPHGRQGRTEQN